MSKPSELRTSQAAKKREAEKKPDRQKSQAPDDGPNKQHKEDFEQLLDDAVLGIRKK